MTAFEDAPSGSITATTALPTAAVRLAGTEAVNWVELTKVVRRAELFQWTAAPEIKPVPFTVSWKVAPVTVAELGLSVEIVGAGGLMVKTTALEAAASGFVTVTLALPAAAIRLAGTDAVSCAALTKVVVSAEPFHCTVEPETKPVP